MPYGAGLFLPSETAYKDPNRFADVLAAEGNKQAAYLADMDQFFAQLEEMKREFDVTAEMKERFFAEEMEFKGEELEFRREKSELDRALQRWTVGEQTSLGRDKLASESAYRSEALGLQREQLEYGREETEGRFDLEAGRLRLEQEESEFLRPIYGAQERRRQETHERASSLVTGGGPAPRDYGGYAGPGVYDPYLDEGFAEWQRRQ